LGRGASHGLAGPMAVAVFCLASAWAVGAQAALSDSLCSPYGAGALKAYPTTEAMVRATAATEAQLAQRGPADAYQDLMGALDLPAANTERPAASALAPYCAATGELMRMSPQGSQLQAQSYLLGAYRMAQGGGLEGTASVAAYRLGLVSLSGSTVAGSRGARRSTRGPTAAVRGPRRWQTSGWPACGSRSPSPTPA